MRPRAHIDEIATRQRRTSRRRSGAYRRRFFCCAEPYIGCFPLQEKTVMGGTPMRQAQSSPIITGVEKKRSTSNLSLTLKNHCLSVG